MTILYSYMANDPNPIAGVACIIFAIILIVIATVITTIDKEFAFINVLLAAMALVSTVFGVLNFVPNALPTTERFCATIDDASLSEVLEEYNIIEQKGSLFILEEKSD